MGKISDVLKKIMEEREQKKSDNKQPETKSNNQRSYTAGGSSLARHSFGSSLFKEKLERFIYDNSYVVKATDKTGIDPHLVAYFDSASPVSEQYSSLRTSIKSYLLKKAISAKTSTIKSLASAKLLAITSSLHAEGKSITAANLAIILAKELDTKVLIIDGDLRNGTMHKFFNIDQKPGLSDILTSDYDYSVALHDTPMKNLFVIPRGPTPENPSELLGSKKMSLILEKLKMEPLAYIIIDTPPVTSFTDGTILCSKADASILVVQAYRTQAGLVRRSAELIKQAHGNLLGMVFTQSDYSIPDFYSYYYHYRDRNKAYQNNIAEAFSKK